MLNCNCSNSISDFKEYDNFPETVEYFQEIALLETLCIPEKKNNMEQITDFRITPKVVSTRLVRTHEALSYSGQNLTGLKIIVELELNKRIKYVADILCQSVHSAHYEDCMKSAFIVVPQKIGCIDTEDLIHNENFIIEPYVLYSNAAMQDERTVLVSAIILINLKFCKGDSLCQTMNI